MKKNMSGDDYCPSCGQWSWMGRKVVKAADVITGEKLSYRRCVYEEHVKLADKLGCHVSEIM
jgi:hypothetical protein